MTLEVNDHLNNGGSFWMMIFAPTKIMVVRKPSYKKRWLDFQGFCSHITPNPQRLVFFFHMCHHFHLFSYFSYAKHLDSGACSREPLHWLSPIPVTRLRVVGASVWTTNLNWWVYRIFWSINRKFWCWLLDEFWWRSFKFSYVSNGLVQPPTSWLLFFPGFFPVIFFCSKLMLPSWELRYTSRHFSADDFPFPFRWDTW